MSIIVIVQARMGSSRLPGKMIKDICGKPLLERVLERVRAAKTVTDFIVAIPDTKNDTVLGDIAKQCDFLCFRGDEQDVLDRFYQAAITLMPTITDEDIIVRVWADNPFIAPEEIDRLIAFYQSGSYDFAFNHRPFLHNRYPDGLGAEILKFSLLRHMWQMTQKQAHREHVCQYVWDAMEEFAVGIVPAPDEIAAPSIKLDVDTDADFQWVSTLYTQLISAHDIVMCAQHEREAHNIKE